MNNKCEYCGSPQQITKHIEKVPKKLQVRFGKTQVWYSSTHKCPKVDEMARASGAFMKVLNNL